VPRKETWARGKPAGKESPLLGFERGMAACLVGDILTALAGACTLRRDMPESVNAVP
jgi:hypothetical protein